MSDATTPSGSPSGAPVTKQVELKDVAVIVPLIGSTLAISFEVGSFTPIIEGSFSLFSITEHIGFALSVLPIAIALSAIVVPSALFFVGLWNGTYAAKFEKHPMRLVSGRPPFGGPG